MASSTLDSVSYKHMMDKLSNEKARVDHAMRKEYRSARKYVRANPETGLIAALAAGLLSGIVLSLLFCRKK